MESSQFPCKDKVRIEHYPIFTHYFQQYDQNQGIFMNINEVGSNLTGGQIQRILDYLLLSALNPLVTKSSVVDNILPKILTNILMDKRRKISALPFDTAVSRLSMAINSLGSDRKKAFLIISGLKIERNVWNDLIMRFLEGRKKYQSLFSDPSSENQKEIARLEQYYGSTGNLFSVFNHVDSFFSHYSKFRSMIISQYINKSHKYAHKFDDGDSTISHQDLTQSLLISVSKGIDKYDCESGALSSYLGYWMLNTSASMSSSFTNTTLAFDIPTSYRQRIARKETIDINYANCLSTLDTEVPANSSSRSLEERHMDNDSMARMLELIKKADTDGVYRLSNGISEFFDQDERSLMCKEFD